MLDRVVEGCPVLCRQGSAKGAQQQEQKEYKKQSGQERCAKHCRQDSSMQRQLKAEGTCGRLHTSWRGHPSVGLRDD